MGIYSGWFPTCNMISLQRAETREETMVIQPPVTIMEVTCPCELELKTVNYSLTWTASVASTATFLKSPPFTMGGDDQFEAHLELKIKAPGAAELLQLEILGKPPHYQLSTYLQLDSADNYLPPIGKLKIQTSDYNNVLFIEEVALRPETELARRGWGFENMCTVKLPSKMAILCHITLTQNEMSETVQKMKNLSLKVGSDLKTFHETPSFADLTLVVGKHSLKAHKVILAARSPVFAAMLQCDMEEKKSSVIHINDFEVETVKGMLCFIYSGQVEDMKGHAEDLLIIADKYALNDLKSACEDDLTRCLSVENAAHMFRIADMVNAKKLMKNAVKFIAKNIVEVQTTKSWKTRKNDSQSVTESETE